MSKVIAATIAVLGAGTVAVGAVYLPKWMKGPDLDLPTTLTDLQKAAHTKGCVPTLLPGLDDVSGTADDVGTSDITETSLTEANKKSETKGCLVVNWDKRTKDDKWSGTIRFLWAARGETKGFLVLLVGTTSNATDKKITWTGTAYTVEKDDLVWKAKKKQAVGESKTFTKSTDSEDKFPNPGDSLGETKNKKFWGLFADKNDVDKVDAAADDWVDGGKYRAYWEWTGDSGTDSKEMGTWAKDLSKWWTDTFTTTHWDMAKVLKDRKGKWTLKYERPASNQAKAS